MQPGVTGHPPYGMGAGRQPGPLGCFPTDHTRTPLGAARAWSHTMGCLHWLGAGALSPMPVRLCRGVWGSAPQRLGATGPRAQPQRVPWGGLAHPGVPWGFQPLGCSNHSLKPNYICSQAGAVSLRGAMPQVGSTPVPLGGGGAVLPTPGSHPLGAPTSWGAQVRVHPPFLCQPREGTCTPVLAWPPWAPSPVAPLTGDPKWQRVPSRGPRLCPLTWAVGAMVGRWHLAGYGPFHPLQLWLNIAPVAVPTALPATWALPARWARGTCLAVGPGWLWGARWCGEHHAFGHGVMVPLGSRCLGCGSRRLGITA